MICSDPIARSMQRLMNHRLFMSSVVWLLFWSSPAVAQRVHVLIVGDASPSAHWGALQPNVELDVINVSALFWNHIAEAQLNLTPLTIETDELASPGTVLDALGGLHPEARDTLVFYFSGHGAADDRGHYLAFGGGRLYRDELREHMQRTKARLVIILTDCCNARADGKRYFAPAPRIAPPGETSTALRSLLLETSGVVDVNASSPNESAFFIPNSDQEGVMPGSLFTKAFVAYVTENHSKTLRWDDLLRSVSFRVHLAFREGYPTGVRAAKGVEMQWDQNVYAFDYPGMPEKNGPRTGVTVRDHNGQGALITSVRPDYPASRAYDLVARRYAALEPNQLIVSANGQAVRNAEEFVKIAAESSQVMRVSITEGAAPKHDYLIRLRY